MAGRQQLQDESRLNALEGQFFSFTGLCPSEQFIGRRSLPRDAVADTDAIPLTAQGVGPGEPLLARPGFWSNHLLGVVVAWALSVLSRSGSAMTAPTPMPCPRFSWTPSTGRCSGYPLQTAPELWWSTGPGRRLRSRLPARLSRPELRPADRQLGRGFARDRADVA